MWPFNSPPKPIRTAFFGDNDAHDGGISLMDGGVHGVQGHTIYLPVTGEARWERRIDSVGPSGKAGGGMFLPTDEERARALAWGDELWELAAQKKSYQAINEPPRWVWAIVIRRGDELRLIEGGAVTWGSHEPSPLSEALAWLRDRVDELGA